MCVYSHIYVHRRIYRRELDIGNSVNSTPPSAKLNSTLVRVWKTNVDAIEALCCDFRSFLLTLEL